MRGQKRIMIDLAGRLAEMGISKREASRRLCVSHQTVCKWADNGYVPEPSIEQVRERGGDLNVLGVE